MFTAELKITANGFDIQRQTIQNSLFPVELEIVEALYSFCPDAYGGIEKAKWKSDRAWTNAVRDSLHALGQKKGYLVLPEKKATGYEGEWLLDMVWADAKNDAQGKPDWKMTRRLALACESEWGTYAEDILSDFYKLTFVITDIRLFVYSNCPTTKTRKEPADLCKAVCPLSNGYRYLLIGFPVVGSATRGFRIDAWTA